MLIVENWSPVASLYVPRNIMLRDEIHSVLFCKLCWEEESQESLESEKEDWIPLDPLVCILPISYVNPIFHNYSNSERAHSH